MTNYRALVPVKQTHKINHHTQIGGTLWVLSFCAWHISLCVTSYGSSSSLCHHFLPFWGCAVPCGLDRAHLVYPLSASGYGTLPPLAAVNNAAVNTSVQTSLCVSMSSFLECTLRWKCCAQYASKFGKLSSDHRSGKGQFSFQFQRKAVPKNAQVKVKVAQSCPTLCDPMAYTVHGVLQARILEWVAFPFSRGSSWLRDRTQVSCIAGRFFTSWVTRETQEYWSE